MTTKINTWRIGRFAFDLPGTFDLVRRIQDIYYVDVSTLELTEGSSVDAVWAHNLAEIISKAPGGERAIEKFQLAPDFPAAYYHVDTDQNMIKLVAHKQFHEHSLVLSMEGKTEKKADMEKLFRIIANGYVAGGSQGFWVGSGSLTSRPGNTEQAKIRLYDDISKVEILVQTRAVVQVVAEDPLVDIQEEIDILRMDGEVAELLLDEPRSINGITGREIHLSTGRDGEASLRFLWLFDGISMEPMRPLIRFEATASAQKREELAGAWETLLSSFRQAH